MEAPNQREDVLGPRMHICLSFYPSLYVFFCLIVRVGHAELMFRQAIKGEMQRAKFTRVRFLYDHRKAVIKCVSGLNI